MRTNSPIIKNKFIKISNDIVVVESGAKEIRAFVLAQKNKPAPDPEPDLSIEKYTEEDDFLYEEQL